MFKRMLPAVTLDDGQVTFVAGRRRYGKTSFLKQEAKRFSRCLVWDWRGEYTEFEPVSLEGVLPALRRESFRLRFVPGSRLDLQKQFDGLSHLLLYAPAAKNFCLIVDEAYLVCPNQQEGGLGKLMRLSGPNGIYLYVSSQRPVLVPGVFRSECDRMVLFHLHNPTDLQTLGQILPSATVQQLPRLARFQYVEYCF